MKRLIFSALLTASLVLPGAVHAQEDDGSAEAVQQDDASAATRQVVPTAAPGGITVVPLGRPTPAPSQADIGREVVMSVPSPAPGAIPGFVDITIGPPRTALAAQTALDSSADAYAELYAYGCTSGTCHGYASDVWVALSRDQRHAYLNDVMNALLAAFPGRNEAWVVVTGRSGQCQDLDPSKCQGFATMAHWSGGATTIQWVGMDL